MTISTTQQVDFLWKKVGYGVSKSDIPSIKDATNENIISSPFLPGDKIWTQSELIPAVKPLIDSSIVRVYGSTNIAKCTEDVTSTINRTWLTGLTDWIPTQFGSTYQVQVYLAPSNTIDPQGTGDQLYAAGSGNDDEWIFDYQSGVLHFIGANLPAFDFTNKSIFIYGGKYIGNKGLTTLTHGTFGDITISGNTISSTSDIVFQVPVGTISMSNNPITNIGYSSVPTNAATVQFVTDRIADLHPNAIWQGDSIVSLNDAAGPGGILSITIDGTLISTFTNTTANIANLSISNTTVSSTSNIGLTPGPGAIVSINASSALVLPVGSTIARPVSAQIGMVRFNSTLGILEVYNGSAWVSSQAQIANQVFVGDSVTYTYLLDQPAYAENILVMINGVVQVPFTAYITSGSSITFNEPPLASDTVEIRFITLMISAGSPSTPSNGTIVVSSSPVLVGTIPVEMDAFSVMEYQVARYTASITTSAGDVEIADVMVAQNGSFNGTNAKVTVTGTGMIASGPTSVTWATFMTNGICVLTAVSSSPGTKIKLHKTYFTV